MSTLTVRRLLVDLDAPLPRRWCGGDAFRTAFFNALSMSFPAGEQLFIDSVKKGLAELPPDLPAEQRERFAEEVRGFIGQEATHRHIHQRFNRHLLNQGLKNRYEERIHARRPLLEGLDTRNWLAVTAATEHFTAVFAEHMLSHPGQLAGAEPRLRDMWLWHCAEETEHRSTAFDLYHALGGNFEWRCRVFKVVAFDFSRDVLRQTLLNLWHDGAWWRPSTWASAWRCLFGRQGLVRLSVAPLKCYLREDFHPNQADGRLAEGWLAAHAELAPPVRGVA